ELAQSHLPTKFPSVQINRRQSSPRRFLTRIAFRIPQEFILFGSQSVGEFRTFRPLDQAKQTAHVHGIHVEQTSRGIKGSAAPVGPAVQARKNDRILLTERSVDGQIYH